MDRGAGTASFGTLLRRWRQRRGLTQMALALDADVSARHVSWIETGRAAPSRAMVLRLAERLDVPLRERNALLQAAGFAPLYDERALADAALTPAREALQRLLDPHGPWPALAVDRHWHFVAANRGVAALLSMVGPALTAPPVDVLRLSLHPKGLAPMIENLPAWRAHVLARVRRRVVATGDAELQRLHEEPRAPRASDPAAAAGPGQRARRRAAGAAPRRRRRALTRGPGAHRNARWVVVQARTCRTTALRRRLSLNPAAAPSQAGLQRVVAGR